MTMNRDELLRVATALKAASWAKTPANKRFSRLATAAIFNHTLLTKTLVIVSNLAA